MNLYMEKAYKDAEKGINLGEGGPFGATIIDMEGNIISTRA